ncbi:hypothetical protein O181_095741 [Austropuccinia psidii MF-1]|uniref:Uncharacterized protein n=1 Tax=Austropuccinia psidii MF-1 TaxID=1389203 RepID=A0A9Q3PDL2_9BASI|nr:hypothetical protein [Austropuccinia psidii MF-1]
MVILGQIGSYGGLWPNLAQVGPIVVWDPPGLGGYCTAPFGLIGLGQKGPNWPTHCDYGPWSVEAVGGLNGPKRPFRPGPSNEKVEPKPMMRARGPRTPQAQEQK